MMQIYFKIIRRFFISLILLVPFSSFAVTCSRGALYGGDTGGRNIKSKYINIK